MFLFLFLSRFQFLFPSSLTCASVYMSVPFEGDLFRPLKHFSRACAQILASSGIAARGDASHGLDHGSWVPLKWMLPGGTIPVVQMSLIDGGSMEDHIELGKALMPLREEGILIVGSGSAVHNIREMSDYFGNQKVRRIDTRSGS